MNDNPAATKRSVDERSVARALRRVIGAGLLALIILPVYRLLDPAETGLAGRYTVGLLNIYYDFAWTGLLLVLPVAIVAARLLTPHAFNRLTTRAREQLLRPRTSIFVPACALLGAAFAGAFSLLVLEGKPNIIDAFAQILQARYWAAGMLAGPTDATAPYWGMQNSLFTDHGWVSQYPPGHVAFLVPFLWLGLLWLLGPVLVFVTILCTGLFAHRLFQNDPVIARLGTVLLAISPFFIFIGASLMSHVTTAALVMLGAYALLRAWDDRAGWALLAGFALALSLATRPLSTLAMGLALAILLPLLFPRPMRRLLMVAAAGTAGAAPVLGAWLLYNDHFFGAPFRLGYSAALGPAMALGFHRDPWGNEYGATEALAYTSSDLVTLGVNLFETPVSAVLVVGLFLLVARHLTRTGWLVLALAISPVLANALYWHHGLYMGPRMLHEAAPAWVLLFAVAAVGVVRRIPENAALARNYFLRPAMGAALLASFAIGLFYLTPRRAASYGGSYLSIARTPLPALERPSLVFVHDAWYARIGMTLAAYGMRLDRIETLIRQNPTCRVDELQQALVAGDEARAQRILATLDTIPRASRLPESVEVSPGDNIRIAEGAPLTPACRREALSDRLGILDISPLLWQADLHGVPGSGILVVRDLGPERNEVMLSRHPGREPFVYLPGAESDEVRLLDYERAMELLWSPPDSTQLPWQTAGD